MTRYALALATALLLVTTACASTGGTTNSGSRDIITQEELRSLDDVTAYRAIERLRPRWLRSRGPVSLRGGGALPSVFVDGSDHGELASLRRMSVTNIESIRFLSSSDATTRYGTGYPSGIIHVRSRR